MAGLSAALMIARNNHDVVLVERDPVSPSEQPFAAFNWPRKGIAHFQQPHAFLPRGRVEMRRHLPDVYSALIAAGAAEVEVWRKLPGGRITAEDRDIVYLSVRRPLIEAALRNAVLAMPALLSSTTTPHCKSALRTLCGR